MLNPLTRPLGLICFDNAWQREAEHIMNIIQLTHIYGQIILKSQPCPKCGGRSFVRDGKISCCGAPALALESDDFKIEIDSGTARRRIPPKKIQAEILEEQGYCCFYCGDQFDSWRKLYGEPQRVLISWDHVIPFSYNGNNHEFVAACRQCNTTKYDHFFYSLEEAKRVLQLKMHEKKTATTRTSVRRLL